MVGCQLGALACLVLKLFFVCLSECCELPLQRGCWCVVFLCNNWPESTFIDEAGYELSIIFFFITVVNCFFCLDAWVFFYKFFFDKASMLG